MGVMSRAHLLITYLKCISRHKHGNLVTIVRHIEPKRPELARYALDHMFNPRNLPAIPVDVYIFEKSVMFFKPDPEHPREWYRFKTIWG